MTPMQEKEQKILTQCHETGEPIFIFRAKDFFSIQVLQFYLHLVEEFGPDNLDFQQSIVEGVNNFRDWQRENMAKVRYPD